MLVETVRHAGTKHTEARISARTAQASWTRQRRWLTVPPATRETSILARPQATVGAVVHLFPRTRRDRLHNLCSMVRRGKLEASRIYCGNSVTPGAWAIRIS